MDDLTGLAEARAEQELSITVAVAYGPTWYGEDWWSKSSHAYDYLGHEDRPYSELPKTTVLASLEDKLGAIYDRAGAALGIAPGPDGMRVLGSKDAPATLSVLTFHVGFYRPSDAHAFDIRYSYHWKRRVPVADLDGSVHELPFEDVTYRQLLASQKLGLIEGDVTRPYICPSMPQGDVPALAHATHVAVEAAKAVYAGLGVAARHADGLEQAARERTDDAQRIGFWVMLFGALRRRQKDRKSKRQESESPGSGNHRRPDSSE